VTTPSALIKVMSDAVRKAARGLTRDFGEVAELQVSKKGPADYVSAADIKSEQVLFEALSAARPGYGFLGEERGLIPGTDKTHTWIADPLDGTTNFLHAIPHFAVTVALEREGQIVAGVTYNPITNEHFWTEKGRGAYLNDKRIRVAARRDLGESVLATGIPFMGVPGHATFLKELHQIANRVSGVRRFGSAYIPMDETLTRCALDLSNRPYLIWKVVFSRPKVGEMDTELFKEFHHAFAMNAGACIHLETLYGENSHHIAESGFKALARALRQAVELDPKTGGHAPSTKGVL